MKKQSNRSSRAVSPEGSKSGPEALVARYAEATKSNGCGEDKSNGSAPSNKSQENDQEDWKKYLGSDDEEKSSIVIRFPDGTRESKELPCSSKFKVRRLNSLSLELLLRFHLGFQAIVKYVESKGFPLDAYEIVTNFPRRILTDLDDNNSLQDLQLFPRETVFVQQRS